MPTITVTIYPKCETVVERADHPRGRKREQPCGAEGMRYLVIGGMGTIEQNLCQAHKKQTVARHPDWTFHELKRAIRHEEREVGQQEYGARAGRQTVKRVFGRVDGDTYRDEDIPF
jgi:hypothetical protein